MRCAWLVVVVLGCRDERLDDLKLEPPTSSLAVIAPPLAPPAPPPPPGPPPPPMPTPPPAALWPLLHADGLPHVVMRRRRGDTVLISWRLEDVDAADLVARLASPVAYTTGDYGCYVDVSLDVEIERGDETFAFSENCGHMIIDGDDHAAMFSLSMIDWLNSHRDP